MPEQPEYPLKGSCNCGYIRYEVTEPFAIQVACHCTQCQKHTQSAFSLGGMLRPEAFRLVSGKLKSWTKTAESGNRFECWFCPECGNRIYHGNPDPQGFLRVKLGTLDDTSVINPQVHAWVKYKQDWYEIPPGVTTFETQPDMKDVVKLLKP